MSVGGVLALQLGWPWGRVWRRMGLSGFIFCPSNVVKATSNEDGEGSSSFVKSQKNFSSNNIMTHNNNSSSSGSSVPRRREVTEEEAER